MNTILVGIVAYIALQFAIGAWVSRTIFTEKDYINAGKSLGLGIASFSVFATWFGAEAIIGSAGNVYAHGLVGGTIDPFGYSTALIVVGLTVAMPLWRRGYTTFADFFRDRYSTGVERLAILLILPGPIIWGAAQMRAFGQVLGSVSEIPLVTGILIGAAVSIAYTVLGGLLADALTDFVQGIAVVIGLVILGAIVAGAAGGFTSSLTKVEAGRLAYFTAGEGGLLSLAEKWAIPIFGTIVSVELISRILGTKSATVARNACIAGGILYLLAGLIPVYLGLVGPQLLPGLAEPEQIIPRLSQSYLGPVLQVVFLGAVISAILSTIDSILLAGGSILSHNVVVPLKPNLDDQARVRMARFGVMMLGLIAFAIALRSSKISDLVETASAFGSAGLIVVVMFGLFTRYGGSLAATAALVTGGLSWGTLSLLEVGRAPYLAAIGIAVVAYVACAELEKRRSR